MNINNVNRPMGYSRNSVVSDLSFEKNNLKQTPEYTDKIDISSSARNISSAKGIGTFLDKGTAANTRYVLTEVHLIRS